ncbi:MAG: lysostaphin resistance A-like protein [Bacteroidales bacterium]
MKKKSTESSKTGLSADFVMKKQLIIQSVIVIMTFLIAFFGRQILSNFITFPITPAFLKIAYIYSWWVIPTALITGLLFGFKNLAENIGIRRGFFQGLIFSAIAVLPMFLSSAIIGNIHEDLVVLDLTHKTLFAGLMEEYLFRGFLFGLLFRKLQWGFIPASLLGAIIFGLGHIYQGSTFPETMGIFMITALGAAWFAWLYIEWNNNLWVPVFLHIFMNLSWTLFDVSDTALGGLYTNVFRAMTIALTIFLTIKYQRKNGLKINKKNLITNTQLGQL